MNSLKRIAAAALSAALCFSMAVPAYADHYQTPKSIKGVLINEHAQIPDVLEVGASQVVLNFPMSWAFSSQLSVCQDLYTKLDTDRLKRLGGSELQPVPSSGIPANRRKLLRVQHLKRCRRPVHKRCRKARHRGIQGLCLQLGHRQRSQ